MEKRVGQRIVLEGIVSNAKYPQIQGVDVLELEEYRGHRVRVSGILRKTVIKESDIDRHAANRGAGSFYTLDEIEYELLE